MAKQPKRKYNPPLKLDMPFEEALGRFAKTAPAELRAVDSNVPVTLYEDDTGARFLIYSNEKGDFAELRYEGDQPWFTQKQLAQMFGVDTDTVSDHIQRFQTDGELVAATTGDFPVVQTEGTRQVRRNRKHYTLDVAFYVGYRVNSAAGMLFRRWATNILIQFATKGFVVDKQRLKEPDDPGLVAELRDIVDEIRASGANAYREVKRICSMCPDYDGSSTAASNFFASIENKMLWVATEERRSMTSAELIMSRADLTKPDMGLTYHTGKRGVPVQKDVITGTNYLYPDEQKAKNRVVDLVLRYFEDQHRQNRTVTTMELESKLNEFIDFNGWPLLTHRGKERGDDARAHAKQLLKEYKTQLN